MTLEELLADPYIPLSTKQAFAGGNLTDAENAAAIEAFGSIPGQQSSRSSAAPQQNFIGQLVGKLRNISPQNYLPSQDSIAKLRNIKVQDYVPNVFGVTDPGVEGLLGAEQSKSLQSRSNIAGLLGAAAALSQGMSRAGPRRSAISNILSAAAGGYGAAGQQYQQSLQTVGQQQQLAQQMRERERAEMTRQAVERVIQSPEIASNPLAVAYFRSNPDKALERQMQMQMAQQARLGTPSAPATAPSATTAEGQAVINQQGEKVMPSVDVTGLSAKYQKAITEAENAADFYSRAGGEENLKISKQYRDEADNYRQLYRQEGLLSGVESALTNIDPTLRARANALIDNAPALTQEQLQTELKAILTDDANLKQEFDPRRIEQKLKVAKAGATTVNVGAKKFGEEFGKGVAGAVETTYQNALAAQNTISTIQTIKPLIQEGVYSGPLSTSRVFIDRLASSLGFASGTTEEKLARTAQSMQGLANLQLEGAKSMAGQGAITDFERGLIERASAGDFAKFTSKEVVSLLSGLEKVANKKITTHKNNLTRLRARPDTSDLVDFYELDAAPDSQPVRQYNPATGRIE